MNGMNRRRGRQRRRLALRRLSERLYGALLLLYPPSLRHAYGHDMRQLFRDTLRDEMMRIGPPGALRAWGVALADLAATLPREWPGELGRWRQGRRRRAIAQRLSTQSAGRVSIGQLLGTRVDAMTYESSFMRFTERARRVLNLAQQEAQRFQHPYIGTEHILLGLVAEGEGVAAKVLENLGVGLEQARNAVEFIIGRGDRIVLSEIGLTPRSKKVIELSIDEAQRLGHHYVGTEHLLLGLVREGEGIAAGVLQSMGVNLERARAETIQALNQGSAFRRGMAQEGPGAMRRRPDLGKFNEAARRVIAIAITEARERGQQEVGTGHALLALLQDDEGVAAQALRESNADVDAARQTLERELGPRTPTGDQPAKGPVSLDAHTLRMIALAADEATRLGDRYVGPEHLLLGLLREGDGLGGQILRDLSISAGQLDITSARERSTGGALQRGPMLGRMILLCRDVAVTRAFYVERLGAEPVADTAATERADGEPLWLQLPGGGSPLALRAAPADTPSSDASIELDIWVTDVDLMWRTLQDAGVAALSPLSDDPDGRAFTLRDPDGRLLRVRANGRLLGVQEHDAS